ncbi:Hypothetical Protein XM38_017380 [Halomicronema hongdechloris C2206]|uniref:Putative restriction endonuclease domain-containing protein n=1 Tax=Halomicronema hongdechloris C2206 TaxID=1641165 RepID=A0A1Z3HKE8_9CYAN|nr:Uma2 family endonuclease [Halomicronema hongdechloris]ASC70791.1 Hypothetical Protein XM38_017380 [Halomicronema hongdechloris C2206]
MVSHPLDSALPPTQHDLPCDDGVPMETQRHKLQSDLLIETLYPWLAGRQDGYVGGNMFLYYSLAQVRHQDFIGPDVFVVLGVPKGERKSWVVWEEGKGPDVVIELLSDSTAVDDKTRKKQVYAEQVRVPEYFWFDPFNPQEWAGFRLVGGYYEPLTLNDAGVLASQQLGLGLVRWQGCYQTVDAVWLRWVTATGDLLPTQAELLHQERQRSARLAERLRALSVDPDDG